MATPPMHIYHSMFLHEALTAVHSSYGYGLLTEPYAYVDAHRHRCVLTQPKGQLSIANYL